MWEVILIVIGFIYYFVERFYRTSRRVDGTLISTRVDLGYESETEQNRDYYSSQLKEYLKDHEILNYLINSHCEMRLIKYSENELLFYCKEKSNGQQAGRYFEVTGNVEHTATMWALINMIFEHSSTYTNIKKFYFNINGENKQYYKEKKNFPYPKPFINKEVQNEFCRMIVEKLPSGEYVLICSEIWENYGVRNKFEIKGSRLFVLGILAQFSKTKNKMETYFDLAEKYKDVRDAYGVDANNFNNKMYDRSKNEINQDSNSERNIDI